MVGMLSENVPLLIGKTVKDEMRNEVGNILSFIIDSPGHVSKALVRDNNGEYKCHPIDRLIVDNDTVILLSEIDKTVKTVAEKIPLLWRKKKVLDKLLNENKILPEIYESLYKEFGEALEKSKIEARSAITELDKQIASSEEAFKMLRLAKTYLEIEHEIGRVEEEAYKESLRVILNGLKSLVEKKQRLQEKRDTLSGILLGEEPIVGAPQPTKEDIDKSGTAEKQGSVGQVQSEPESLITVRVT